MLAKKFITLIRTSPPFSDLSGSLVSTVCNALPYCACPVSGLNSYQPLNSSHHKGEFNCKQPYLVILSSSGYDKNTLKGTKKTEFHASNFLAEWGFDQYDSIFCKSCKSYHNVARKLITSICSPYYTVHSCFSFSVPILKTAESHLRAFDDNIRITSFSLPH